MSDYKKTIVITGASDGIGAAAARQLHDKGCEVVLVGRSPDKTKRVADALGVAYYLADFAHLGEVRPLAEQLLQNHERIDGLLNNAGGMFNTRQMTEDGHELTFQVNHLAHFLLTNLLLERLLASRAIVINTSSIASRYFAELDMQDLDLSKGYTPKRAYGNAKLANILFTCGLHERFHKQGLSSAAVHPGIIATNFAGQAGGLFHLLYHTPLRRLIATADDGAAPLVRLVTSTPDIDWQSGSYYERDKPGRLTATAQDPAIADALWDVSARYVGLR